MNPSATSTMTGKTKIKIVFLGGQGVGKTSVIQKYIHDQFNDTANPTVGIDFLAKNVTLNNKNYRLQLWDTAGQQRFKSLIPSYLKDAHAAIIVFDINSKTTFEQIQGWVNMFNQNKNSNGFIMLVGNKIDINQRQVQSQQGQNKAKDLGLHYYQISAKSGQNIDKVFMELVRLYSQGVQAERQLALRGGQASINQTQTKLTNDCKEGVVVEENDNVVLKNQKISTGQRKACC